MQMLITTNDQIKAFCEAHMSSDFVTVDTEFMRERTYYPKLCLVQLGGRKDAVAIDPLAQGVDLTPLFSLMANPKVLKVFHAARQDIEIFVNLTGKVPSPMFDTQVAAMVCGYGESASYETLAANLAQATVDKSSRFTDWARRPLTQKQIDYAIGDVTHLRKVFERLSSQLQQSQRSSWLAEEMEILTNAATYQVEPNEIWRRFKWRAEKPRLRALLRELAAWREIEAQRLDVPRGRILRDEAVAEIAHHAPSTVADLAGTRGLHQSFADSKQGADVLAAVKRGLAVPMSECPEGDDRKIIPGGVAPIVDLLKVLLKHVCEDHGVASKLIANVSDLELIAQDDEAKVPALSGWRRQLFGDLALALKRGELALTVKDKRIKFISTVEAKEKK